MNSTHRLARHVIAWLCAVGLGLACTSCARAATAPTAPDLSQVKPLAPDRADTGSLLVVRYHRPDGDYEGWNVWAWEDDRDGSSHALTGRDAFGAYARINFPSHIDKVNFIVRLNEWEKKDVDRDRSATVGKNGVVEIWLVSEDPNVYVDPKEIDFGLTMRAAFLDRADLVRVTLSQPMDPEVMSKKKARLDIDGNEVVIKQVKPFKPSGAHLSRGFDLKLARPLEASEIAKPITLKVDGFASMTVHARHVLSEPRFVAADAKLGAYCTKTSTTFRTWSPVCRSIELLLFDSATAPKPSRTIPLSRDAAGVWSVEVDGRLHGTYYQYRFHSYGKARSVADVHCFAATPDSARSMVVDLSLTDPEGFDEHPLPKIQSITNEVIYEVHVRDYSIGDASAPAEHRGRFLGMTHLNPGSDGKASSGISHLKDLGVTAVHLLPIQDYTARLDEYNWGYWTALFNVPEAQYGTKPHDPANTIRELKQTIQTLHEHDIRVILDVVYNHTSTSFENSPFDQAVPWYYFRTTYDGRLRNESGCGNAFADERPMARKYIVDSLKYWVTEYKVDGFRFDLLGMHHPETVAQVIKELRAIRPDLTIYGEPWTGGGPIHFGRGDQRGTTVAIFNDHIRNAIRGDLDGKETGFATGAGGDVAAIKRGVVGGIDDFTARAGESINYVSAHDNRTFWDKLGHTDPTLDDAAKRAMQKLAHGIVLTSQGVPFIHGGADFARTKGGHHNSYDAGDKVNRFDWERKTAYADVHRYLSGLIELRHAHPAFRMDEAKTIHKAVTFLEGQEIVAFVVDGKAANDVWPRILVAYNGEPAARELVLPKGRWAIVVDDRSAGVETLRVAERNVKLPAYSMVVAHPAN